MKKKVPDLCVCERERERGRGVRACRESTTLAKKIETGTQAKHWRVHARQITRLCHLRLVVSIFLARVVENSPYFAKASSPSSHRHKRRHFLLLQDAHSRSQGAQAQPKITADHEMPKTYRVKELPRPAASLVSKRLFSKTKNQRSTTREQAWQGAFRHLPPS